MRTERNPRMVMSKKLAVKKYKQFTNYKGLNVSLVPIPWAVPSISRVISSTAVTLES
jgi:hypothetical protein